MVRSYPSPVPKTKDLQPWINLSGTNFHLSCSRLQDSRESRLRKVAQKPQEGWGETGKRACKHCFSYFIPVYQLLVYQSIWLVNFDSWRQQCLRARRVRQTLCKTLLHNTFWHEKCFFFLEVRGLVGGIRYFKDAYRLSLFSSLRFLLFHPHFSLVCFDHRERGTG